MSTVYVSIQNGAVYPLTIQDLAKLEAAGLKILPPESDSHLVISDGDNFLWAYPGPDGTISGFERWGANRVQGIIEIMEREIGVMMLSEHDDMYMSMFYSDDEEPEAKA